ncbi:cytochrome d ubiquinol oxidase subunit II [Tamlana sp. 2_MG-2023]|uniref:cytochrome d ubiquinol oxidase subunit II n=1 Tax=unclassified Tamlana TaxID=2614803 RepID=UPI0026E1D39C|nr:MULTISPECIES: cytochrome d ubiquinol oxidase subunit II [unclassified Tamlana]MDO6759138.1 cytochrome d ubiquinol oxidase subunit II [Tamlana sp. 2_MG-2023]MDO6789837.1 cytochrome d ubiquinol oxidase subunit II [Tamlana sp. 1_MG-2023]
MLNIVLFFLMVSLLLYVILAGADFGAGIVELFSTKKNQQLTKKTIYRVMGPVWEANHIWIIILVVILWVGFPKFYNVLVVYLHIPLTLVLLGITIRGVAFVFRHYDAFKDKSQILYDWMFRFSSLITPIFLGMTAGSMLSGQLIITENYQDYSFVELFIQPWFNGFSILVGVFFAALCAFLASILLIGESHANDRHVYVTKAEKATVAVVGIGFIVICYGFYHEITFVTDFIKTPITLGFVFLSFILIFPLVQSIKKAKKVATRALAGIQVTLILAAAFVTHFPVLIIAYNTKINLLETASPEKVINVLAISLIIGGAVILPGLFHLMKSFKMIKVLDD